MADLVDRLRSGRVSASDGRRAADEIEMLCMALDGLERDRKEAASKVEDMVKLLMWISNGAGGATVDDLRYVAEMKVAEVTG